MKYAICNETFGDWPLESSLRLAAETGYTGWEVAPFMLSDDIFRFSDEARADYRRRVEQAGLQITGLHWLLAKTQGFHLTTLDAAVRHRTADYLRELVRLCGQLGGEVMVLGSPLQRNRTEGQSTEIALDNAAEVLRAVVPTLEEHSVKIALEPLGPEEGDFLNTADEALELRSRIGSEQVGLHLDVKAMSAESIPIPDLIRRNAKSLLHFHANDPNRRGPGMGDVDFVPIFAALREIGYEGWVSVEVFDYTPGVERLVTESMRNMEAARAAIGG